MEMYGAKQGIWQASGCCVRVAAHGVVHSGRWSCAAVHEAVVWGREDLVLVHLAFRVLGTGDQQGPSSHTHAPHRTSSCTWASLRPSTTSRMLPSGPSSGPSSPGSVSSPSFTLRCPPLSSPPPHPLVLSIPRSRPPPTQPWQHLTLAVRADQGRDHSPRAR